MLLYFELIFVCGASIFPSIFFFPPAKTPAMAATDERVLCSCDGVRRLSSIGSTNTHDTQRITFRTSNIKVMDAHTHTQQNLKAFKKKFLHFALSFYVCLNTFSRIILRNSPSSGDLFIKLGRHQKDFKSSRSAARMAVHTSGQEQGTNISDERAQQPTITVVLVIQM